MLAEVVVTVGGLETMRADWLEEFAQRAAAAVETLREKFKTGMVYSGKDDGKDVELVISRGTDLGDVVLAVLQTTGAELAATRFEGQLESREDGSAWWQGARTDVISPGEGEFADREELMLRAEGEGLTGLGDLAARRKTSRSDS